jgi:hypothetical protein
MIEHERDGAEEPRMVLGDLLHQLDEVARAAGWGRSGGWARWCEGAGR